MKVNKETGKVTLARNERRIGNFIVKDEEGHVKVMDINTLVTHRVRKTVAMGRFLEACFKGIGEEAIRKSLANYVAVMWSFSCCVPDAEFLMDVYKATEACMGRHKDVYGVRDAPQTDEADAEALRAVREEREFEDDVRKAMEEETADRDGSGSLGTNVAHE